MSVPPLGDHTPDPDDPSPPNDATRNATRRRRAGPMTPSGPQRRRGPVFCGSGAPAAGYGVSDPVRFGKPCIRLYGDADGLPANVIECMTFDSRGYLWVGTPEGAAVYNGRAWSHVGMPNRQRSN